MATATTSLLDLISAGLLQAGAKVMVRDIEGELTPQGTITSTTERGTIEYKTPTAFSKAVTNSTSGGWQQVKLKSSGGTTSLFDVKRKFAGYTKRVDRGNKRPGVRRSAGRDDDLYTPGTPRHHHNRHATPVAHISASHYNGGDDSTTKVALNNISLPVVVRFRDDDTKRGKLHRMNEDFSTVELDYRGKTYHSVSSAAKEMCREYSEDTGETVQLNGDGIEDIRYQTPAGDWCKLRDLFPVERRKRTRSSHVDEDEDEEDEAMSDESDPPTPPPLSPPSPSSSTTPPPQRSTMIAKHIKHQHGLIPSSSSDPLTPPTSTPILPIKPPTSPPHTTSINGSKPAPIVLSLKSPPAPAAYSSHSSKRVHKDIELLVHVESTESIPYEVIGTADSYESLRNRIAFVIPDFPFNQAHELGVYSEYWEKHAGVAYVKPPRSWADFPPCTTILLKKIPETIIINNPLDL